MARVEQQKIILTPLVRQKLKALLSSLIYKGYFTYIENASNYIEALRSVVYTIPTRRHYHTNSKRYGAFYCRYSPNKHTTWYITFDTDGQTFLVKNIFNNHTKDYPSFVRNL